jgi:pilus assembly protein Flp/PilA
MSKLTTSIRRFVRDEQGATMAEYALLVAVVAIVAVAGAKVLGTNLKTRLTNTGTAITKTY